MENEAFIRLGIFVGLFALIAMLEAILPRRKRRQTRTSRWFTNWSIVILDTLTLRLIAVILPLLAIGASIDAERLGWGLFNQISLPFALEIVLTILIFDFAIWAQHVVSHKIPILWRIHRVHHADRDMDVTTAIRFHPVEIAFSMLLKIGLVYLLGPAALAILIFEILLNGSAMFNHANLKLPLGLDRILRLFVVTPDMHRIHHSVTRDEHDSNYGFALSWWDRLFQTYSQNPRDGHEDMEIGLEWQDDRPSKLGWSLSLPFQRK
ncbi:sterol desaturase family protein [Parasulfitobacter algicola]|uniref:Sterol desaturase family protein n=1 Tax=Parasulfitobacter algicola TaxID=2614809 RepID=A0ABX2IZE0_9RHOB|nr:sterol desaturase family protein [Sulfitobacter algicola]NSX56023.1 sterol desaturase family protein [Sulfitobacter algicola]